MITLITDKKIIKQVKLGFTDIGNAVPLNNWVYGQSDIKSLFNKPNTECLFLYLSCRTYKQILDIFNVNKSSFVFDTYRRYKHYVLEFKNGDNTYYFTLSYNKDRGMDFYICPHMNDIEFSFPNNINKLDEFEDFNNLTPVVYNFFQEIFSKIIFHVTKKYTLNEFLDSEFPINDSSIISLIFENPDYFLDIMPKKYID